jgi:hypothetical protein
MSEHYTIQTNQGVKHGPMTHAELEDMARHGRVKPMTMVLVEGTGRWQVAASIPEVRSILKKLHPSQSILFKERGPSFVEKFGKKASKLASKFRKSDKKKEHAAPLSHSKEDDKKETGELYTVRAGDGVEYGPADYDEIKRFVKLGRIKATTMIFKKSSKRWHLAASILEIRSLLRRYNPGQNSVLDRIRAIDHAAHDPRRSSTVRLKIKNAFWKKFFLR